MIRQLVQRFLRKVQRILRKVLRKVFRLSPYPQIWAAITGARIPCTSIYDGRTALVRPEGIAFTRTGDLLATSCSEGNSVNVYTKKNEHESTYRNKPCFMTIDSANLNYVHDVAFSPCGRMLAAAAREDHSVSIFVRKTMHPTSFGATEACVIRGAESRLGFPTGVSFYPGGEYLAVANRKNGGGITLYRVGRHCDGGGINPVLIQSVSEEDLLAHDLAAPHGLEFSPDGTSLIVTHKRFYKTQNPRGKSAIAIFRWQTAPYGGIEPNPIYVSLRGQESLHSVAVHPSGRYFSVTNETGDIEVFAWRANESFVNKVDSISIFKGGEIEGAKGVAFTSDGKQLAATTVSDQVLFFSNWKMSPG